MNSRTSANKTKQKSSGDSSQHSAGGENAAAMTPPDYGIDFVDNGMAASMPVQCVGMPEEAELLAHQFVAIQRNVQPMMQMKDGVPVNNDDGLEREADVMGAKAAVQQASKSIEPDPIDFQHNLLNAASPVIQRKVGFEFETGVMISTDPTKYKIPYDVQVFESKDQSWQIKSDNSKVEFVTREVSEDDAGKKKLVNVMYEVMGWAKGMAKKTQPPTPLGKGKISEVSPSLGTARLYKNEDVVLHTRPITASQVIAAPQATGGITLDKIQTLIKKMVETPLEHLKHSQTFKPIHVETNELYDVISEPLIEGFESSGYETSNIAYAVGSESLFTMSYLTSAAQVVEDWIKEIEGFKETNKEEFDSEIEISTTEFRNASGNLQGLLSLVISYLNGGAYLNKPIPYTKAVATLMSRTNIHSLYGLLTTAEKKLFTFDIVSYISELDDGQLFKSGFSGRSGVQKGPTRKEWIDSIISGTEVKDLESSEPTATKMVPYDRLSQGSRTPEALNSASLGAMAQPDYSTYSDERNLAVLEIRNIPKNQQIDDWFHTAMIIFEIFRELNEPEDQRIERLRREQVQREKLRRDAELANSKEFCYRF